MIQARQSTDGGIEGEVDGEVDVPEGRRPDWWHRDHPVFTPLVGFFSGLAFMLLVPGLFAALLESVFSQHTVRDLFPFVLVMLVVPTVLLVRARTRRVGLYFLLGMVTTAAVVLGVGSLVLWVMVNR
jgi:hypothetical protein